jgi:hypothetical protein
MPCVLARPGDRQTSGQRLGFTLPPDLDGAVGQVGGNLGWGESDPQPVPRASSAAMKVNRPSGEGKKKVKINQDSWIFCLTGGLGGFNNSGL